MRKIEFRGKNAKGEWIYGDLLRNRGETFIAPEGIANPLATADDFRVDPETIGQFIGIQGYVGNYDDREKNRRDLYEGDVVEAWSEGSHATFEIKWRHGVHPGWILYPAWQNKEMWSISAHQESDDSYFDALKIIGNIHDSPELMAK